MRESEKAPQKPAQAPEARARHGARGFVRIRPESHFARVEDGPEDLEDLFAGQPGAVGSFD